VHTRHPRFPLGTLDRILYLLCAPPASPGGGRCEAAFGIMSRSQNQKPVIVVDGARIELDGVEVLVILTPFAMDFEEEDTIRQICECSRKFPVVFARLQADGKYSFFGNAPYEERLRAKSAAGISWTKVPIYR